MAYGDDNSLMFDIINLIGTLIIIGIMFYLYLSYVDLKSKTTALLADYEKRSKAAPAPAPAPPAPAPPAPAPPPPSPPAPAPAPAPSPPAPAPPTR